jgi:murein DD-endopeptidase MepM/ murein hydrolase activator NlpD
MFLFMGSSTLKTFLFRIAVLLLIEGVAFIGLTGCGRKDAEAPPLSTTTVETPPEPPAPRNPWQAVSFPTDQKRLLDPNAIGVFQPTASGRLESAMYGTVRMAVKNGRLMPSFHEGIDIAPMQRDRARRPLDPVYAVAEGKVAYINRVSGNSNYGVYVVLLHADPLGDCYTLYAHLASVAPGLRQGQLVQAGEVLGTMGHSSSSAIPVERSHLHFEVGLLTNERFSEWYNVKKLKPDHGLFNGRNLLAIDPLEVFRQRQGNDAFTLQQHFATIPAAYELILSTRKRPDFFRRYPSLWEGEAFSGQPIVITCSENGVPLRGRNATEAERAKLGQNRIRVQNVNANVLGKNGRRLVVLDQNGWRPGQNNAEWLEILCY